MLKPAQLYEKELQEEIVKAWYKTENIFYDGGTGDSEIDLPRDNYNSHHFVSIDKENNVIGYISYCIDWSSLSADRFAAISFKKGSIEFAKDLYEVVCNIFEKYNLNRLGWWCFADNPAISGYRNFIKKHGGRECGYQRQIARLQDGRLHDSVEFEILSVEWRK